MTLRAVIGLREIAAKPSPSTLVNSPRRLDQRRSSLPRSPTLTRAAGLSPRKTSVMSVIADGGSQPGIETTSQIPSFA